MKRSCVVSGDSTSSVMVGLDEYLHSTMETENKVEGGFFLNVMVRQGATVMALKLFACKDKALLVGNARDNG
jgi:hypothetical protein